MRTIKFRAWHKINKIMYWWDIIWGNHARGDGYIGMAPWGEDRHTPGSYRGNMVLIDPDNCEIMQFTGLTDKNGREIYEGDILFMGDKKPVIVGWSKMFASFIINRDGWMYSHWFGESCDPEDCEVIGNIYENPELLNDE